MKQRVDERIKQIFDEIAEDIGDDFYDLDDMTEDESAGIPFEIFKACEYMRKAWKNYIDNNDRAWLSRL